ncbi:MAG: heme-copper oxidase subunit III [Chloroflexi bacterium]|nr:MAG: heme-copper oxidase subunit III [Chloroflexota bacterium]
MSSITSDLKYQLVNRRLGLWLFILSEAMIFIALLSTRFYMQGVNRPEELNQTLGLAITVILLISSFTANRAEVMISQGDQRGFLRNLGVTLVLGLVFLLVVVAVEWPEASHFAPISTGYGTIFYVITGMHAFHVLTGLIVLAIVYLQGRQGRFSKEDHWNAQGGIVYWHFVDVVWVFVYPILYLLGP